ncbi:MAG: N-6 DNA methylase [Candidatus Hodarchaeota archaeon]
MVENKKVIDSKFVVKSFGLNSQIYKEAIQHLKKGVEKEDQKYIEHLEQRKSFYKRIYNVIPNRDLLLKQTYYVIILKLILTKKLRDCNAEKDVKFNEFNEFLYNHLDEYFHEKIFETLDKGVFLHQDLFHDLYQQIFFPIIRHRLGEFYTSQHLVKMMVEDFYEFGNKILDPACGSGSFLVEILLKILNSNFPKELKKKAIANVYGFDINPLATLTTKINLVLILSEFFEYDEYKNYEQKVAFMNSLFPTQEDERNYIRMEKLKNSFDLIIGNPPWLTYKDIQDKSYQTKIRTLAESLNIKPPSQYITHIELATIFFYAIPKRFLKLNGKIFFVITKSVLNGDHCYKFRKFSIFNDLEIWDFPNNYFFNINHICLKARYIGENSDIPLSKKYPITTKIFNGKLDLQEETRYNSIKIEKEGAKIILPEKEIRTLNDLSFSKYKDLFFQGATLVPRTLVFFDINNENDENLTISSDSDILSRAKKNWIFKFQNKTIEKRFRFKTLLNMDLIPFYIKKFRNIFLPINETYEFDVNYLVKYTKAYEFYNKLNDIYQNKKKPTSKIETLFSNLNYWNKLSKQYYNKRFIVVYNASGSMIKAAVIDNYEKDIIIASENYYFSTDILNEAYYLSSVLNSPILTKNIKLIKSSRHIHKRPFSFPIPIYDNEDLLHRKIANKGKKSETLVQDLFYNNPKISPSKVRIFIKKKLEKLDLLTKEIVFGLEIKKGKK